MKYPDGQEVKLGDRIELWPPNADEVRDDPNRLKKNSRELLG